MLPGGRSRGLGIGGHWWPPSSRGVRRPPGSVRETGRRFHRSRVGQSALDGVRLTHVRLSIHATRARSPKRDLFDHQTPRRLGQQPMHDSRIARHRILTGPGHVRIGKMIEKTSKSSRSRRFILKTARFKHEITAGAYIYIHK